MTADELYAGVWALGIFMPLDVVDETDRQATICETIRQQLEDLAESLRVAESAPGPDPDDEEGNPDDYIDRDVLGVRLDHRLYELAVADAFDALVRGCDMDLVDQCVTIRRALTDMAANLPLKLAIRAETQ